jgi:NAD(P)-dependent dehydrogenase (short-subunit alcohol dehydrogenase family)
MHVGALEGRRLLVVGASSGMGRATALSFARSGAHVAFAARRCERLDEAVADAGSGHAVTIDVRDPLDIRRAVDDAATRLGGLDGVLYTAGTSPLARLRDLTSAQWHDIFAVNTFGPSLVTAAALAHLSADSVVAFVSSDSVEEPRHSLGAYAAAKAAMESTLRCWRTEEVGGRRFVKIVVGPTLPTEFGDQFDPEDLAAVFVHWQRQGFRTGLMAADHVAAQITTTFETLFACPGFGVETLFLRAPDPAAPLEDFGLSIVDEQRG